MKKTLIWVLIILLLAGGGFYLFNKLPNTSIKANTTSTVTGSTNNTNNSSTSSNTNTNSNPYTVNTVATHNSLSSCWSIVSGKVYNLTSYINKHPGGQEQILAICGKDGTSLFEGQHGGNMKIENILSSFYLGNLSN